MDTTQPVRKGFSFYIKRVAGAILLVALSAVFFYSAYSKIYSENAFDNFQWSFLDLGISSIVASGIIARMMIGMELLLGLLLLFHVYLRKFTYPAVIGILTIFVVYLLVVLLKQGNSGNCGCFGDKLAMKPLTAIWKNLIMIAVTIALWYLYPIKPYKFQEYVLMVLALAAFTTPFLLNNLYTGTAPEKVGKPINLELLYKYEPAPTTELRTGKHIIAFMSLTCPHCKKAAYLLQIIHHEHPDLPIMMVLDGSEPFKKPFFDETHAQDVPYFFYHHIPEFTEMAGSGVPAILWVNNSVVEYKSIYAYYQLDPKYMQDWLKKPAMQITTKGK